MLAKHRTVGYIRKTSSVLISLDLLDSRGSSVSKTENCVLICLKSRERLQIVLGLYGDFSLILACFPHTLGDKFGVHSQLAWIIS